MSTRTTVILLALVLCVGSYLWWEQAAGPPSHAPPAVGGSAAPAGPSPTIRPFFDFHPDQVVRLHLQREGIARSATRAGRDWPSPAIADFLRVLTEIGLIMDISTDTDQAADYGLQPPRGEAALYLAGDRPPLVLRFGDRNPPSTAIYVQVGANGPIALAGALLDWEFDKAFQALGAIEAAPAR